MRFWLANRYWGADMEALTETDALEFRCMDAIGRLAHPYGTSRPHTVIRISAFAAWMQQKL